MESLPLDLRRKIALDLSPKELIELCLASKEVFYKGICKDDEFWRLKIEYDYPEVIEYFRNNNLILRNPKNTYIRVFSKLSEIVEKYSKKGKVSYDFLFSTYNEMRKKAPYKNFDEFNKNLDNLIEKDGRILENKKFIKDYIFDIFMESPLYKIHGAKFLL